MPSWILALSIAILVATVPMSWLLRILTDLPRPLILSYRRWPAWANLALIGVATANVAVFIRTEYYGAWPGPLVLGLEFSIAGGIYVFGIVLLLRQFAGLYPEYVVTTGRTGLSMRKALYRNVADIQTVSESRGESRLRLKMRSGEILHLDLPTRDRPVLLERIRKSQPQL